MTLRYNVISYLIGEGIRNVFKQKKSTVASLMIMCAAMLIFGVFFTLGENINHIMTTIEKSQGIQVFIKNEATEDQVKEVGENLKKISGINTVEYVSKEEALQQMKEKFEERKDLLSGYDEKNIFPESYVVTLTDLNLTKEVKEQIQNIENVKRITSSDETISTLIKIGQKIRIATAVLLIMLIVISVFIISNTIKLTVHARRKEISIMKYVGATNSFIRWPFIVEGIIIGIVSGFISILIVGLSYNAISENVIKSDIVSKINFSLVSFSDMFSLIIIVYMVLGIGIGIIGSSISMRKYLKV